MGTGLIALGFGQVYHIRWLLSECAYNSWRQGNMHLTRNSCLMNGWGNSGRCFRCVKPFIQQGRASSKYFGERHSWPSHLQAELTAACRRNTNLGTGGGQQPWQIRCQSSQACYYATASVVGHGPREFLQVFWHFLRHGEAITCEVTDRRKRCKATSQR